ncbi:MAG TPA: hypothetical protein VNJ54_09295 [Plantibacter sp.]|uniref:hypothetical protein n=1 Tax=unclassified Plantibacter TaxID=2624265 RepID=UPI002BC972DB|nr:hypothetical protein [Plantibacter sp.]
MTELVIAISVVTMLAVAVIGFVVQHHIDRDDADTDPRQDPDDSDTGGIELPRPSV